MQPAAATRSHLVDREVDVVDRDLAGDDEPSRVDRAELEQRVVERAGGLVRALPHQVEVPVRADLAVEDLDVHAVDVHVGEALDGIGVAGPSVGRVGVLDATAVGLRGVAAEHLAERLGQRVVVRVVEAVREVALHLVVLDAHVRVGGDQSGHGPMLSRPGRPWLPPTRPPRWALVANGIAWMTNGPAQGGGRGGTVLM